MNSSFLAQEENSEQLGELAAVRHLASFARPWRGQFLLAFTLLWAASASAVVGAFFLGRLVERGLLARSWEQTLLYGSLIILCECLAVAAVYAGRRMLAVCSSRALLAIRQALFHHIGALPLRYYDTQPQGRTVTRMTHDVESLEEFFTMSMGRMCMSTIRVVCCIAAMLLTSPLLGVMVTAAMLPSLAATVLTRTRVRRLQRVMAGCSSSINARLAEFINGIGVLRNFGLEDWSQRQFNQRVTAYLNSCMAVNRFNAWLRPSVELLCMLPLLCLLLVGGRMVLQGLIGIGVFVAFVRYLDQFVRPVINLSREVHVVQKAFTGMERVSHFLRAATEGDVLGADGRLSADRLSGRIEFRDVMLSYDGQETVLKGISFEIRPGEKVGLLGRTGSGKTSTVSVLTRLYEFQQGEVLLDGRSLRDFGRRSLREAVGFVSQDVTIFRGRVRSNLDDCGRFPASRVEAAAERTGLLEVLGRAGLSLDSELLDRGLNLSVGQRQLVALTRILLKEPRILILDEATANIDPELEQVIHHAVDVVMSDRTCLLIAHRLETLQACDRLLVFRDGCIVEQGRPFELQLSGSYYQELVASSGTF